MLSKPTMHEGQSKYPYRGTPRIARTAGSFHSHFRGLCRVPCEDVASMLLQTIESPAVNRLIIQLTQGDTLVNETMNRLACD